MNKYAGILGTGALTAAMMMSPHSNAKDVNGALVLQSQGSFFIGGKIVTTNAANGEARSPFGQDGTISVDQMYVQYQIPVSSKRHVPVVLIHGGTVSGTNYETTPDGRMGWNEYFARKGRATYVVDQVGRGRSGFDVTPFNQVRLGIAPPGSQPAIRVLTREQLWTIFRFGPAYPIPYNGQQFPIEAVDELAKQAAPTQNSDNRTHLFELSKKLEGAVLVSHSQSGNYPQDTVLKFGPSGIRGIVNMEPGGGCGGATLTDAQVRVLAQVPYMALFGDFMAESTSTIPNWQNIFKDCQTLVSRLKAAGGDAAMIHLPTIGITGNSHMLMQDKNNLVVADVIHDWIESHVETNRNR